MILSFRHRRLARLYRRGDIAGLPPQHVDKLRRILAALDAAEVPADLALPGYRLHPLKGNRRGFWSVRVSANWRVTFRFDGTDVSAVDLVDYH